ncbi:N-acetylmuramoyl-L-alanine amidase [Yoonia sp. R2-816]|uniref:N-acetylmuramoyl-L-alanine amidase family protein n=1 Tax=Yoonia sp. R2-816 TaxID=3342638 RepID=UPI0037295D3E
MIRLVAILLFCASSVWAEVRIDPARSVVRDGWWSLRVELGLSDVTPYRVYTLDDPRRLFLEFEGLDGDGVDLSDVLEPGRATNLRLEPMPDGWSRLVVTLAEPMAVAEAGMLTVPQGADLTVVMERSSVAAFAASARSSGLKADATLPEEGVLDAGFVVAIDPGHGGIDPGADRGGVQEAPLMLQLAREVAAALADMEGVQVVLTREADDFVSLERRISLARAAGADLLISLHADALEEDEAQGASVYTLGKDGGDAASRRMVERHERVDLLEGVDLTGQGDQVATVLLDIARRDTGPEGQRFADLLVQQMRDRGVRLNARPRREGQFAVLSAADFPSVLVEAGFLSNARDRERLLDVGGRAPLVRAIADAVAAFAAHEG